jgi:methylated-DNA-[protein]-cysteine S-methyltransferase
MKKMKELQRLLRKIPKGKITTYKIIARKLRVHPRVAGMLLSKNDSDAPCYKVINHNGKIGGYSGRGGIKGKIKLLRRDGIIIRGNKIDLKKFLFKF